MLLAVGYEQTISCRLPGEREREKMNVLHRLRPAAAETLARCQRIIPGHHGQRGIPPFTTVTMRWCDILGADVDQRIVTREGI